MDNLGADNKPSLPALLDALTEQFVAHHFDLKWFIGELVNSETYQLASTGAATDALPRHFERARIRPLSAEELMTVLRVATAYDPAQKGGEGSGTDYFLRYFGEPVNGQGDFQGSLSEHLFLNHSSNVRAFLSRKKATSPTPSTPRPTRGNKGGPHVSLDPHAPAQRRRAREIRRLPANRSEERKPHRRSTVGARESR